MKVVPKHFQGVVRNVSIFLLIFALQFSRATAFIDGVCDISSDEVKFKAGVFELSGNVSFSIDDTKVLCDEAMIAMPQGEQDQNVFDRIDLQGSVKISFGDKGTILCSSACMEGQEGCVNFYGSPAKYIDSKSSTVVSSDRMKLWFDNGGAHALSVRKMTAEGDVTIVERDKFTATGQKAEYCPLQNDRYVTLTPNSIEPLCTLSSGDGRSVKMTKALFAMDTNELFLENPDGKLALDDSMVDQLFFKAEQLYWNISENMLALVSKVMIRIPNEAEVTNDDRVVINWKEESGRKVVTRLTGLGKSEIKQFDQKGNDVFIIKEEGIAALDIDDATITIASDPHQEIHYYDHLGHVFGTHLAIHLVPNTKSLTPEYVYLNGNVKLLSGGIVIDDELKGATQYVMADSLKYNPDKKSLILRSNKGNRVLYYDRINNLQMSAPKLVMKKQEGMERPSVKGIGDVRFRLMEQEIDQIKKRFYFDEQEQET